MGTRRPRLFFVKNGTGVGRIARGRAERGDGAFSDVTLTLSGVSTPLACSSESSDAPRLDDDGVERTSSWSDSDSGGGFGIVFCFFRGAGILLISIGESSRGRRLGTRPV